MAVVHAVQAQFKPVGPRWSRRHGIRTRDFLASDHSDEGCELARHELQPLYSQRVEFEMPHTGRDLPGADQPCFHSYLRCGERSVQ